MARGVALRTSEAALRLSGALSLERRPTASSCTGSASAPRALLRALAEAEERRAPAAPTNGPRCLAPAAPSLAEAHLAASSAAAPHQLADAAAVETPAQPSRPMDFAFLTRCRWRAGTHLRCAHPGPSASAAAAAPAAAPSLQAGVLRLLAQGLDGSGSRQALASRGGICNPSHASNIRAGTCGKSRPGFST